MSQSEPPTDASRTAASRPDSEAYRCHRRCEDGAVCTQIVQLPGAPCYHHSGQERIDVDEDSGGPGSSADD